MLKKITLALLVLWPALLMAQTTKNGLVITGLSTKKPPTCNIGDQFNATDTGIIYVCGPTPNVWSTPTGGPGPVGPVGPPGPPTGSINAGNNNLLLAASTLVTTATDNFNRANGGLGATWTTATGLWSIAPTITGNQVVGNTPAAAQGAYYTGAGSPSCGATAGCWAQVTVPVGGNDPNGEVAVLLMGNGSNNYFFGFFNGQFRIIDSGSGTNLGETPGSLASGDKLLGTVSVSSGVAYITGYKISGLTTTLILQAKSTAYITGTTGIGVFGNVSVSVLDDFVTGTFSNPSPIGDSGINSSSLSLVPQQPFVQYVTSTGNDSNAGLSWGNGKATWDAACEALPGGFISGTTHHCGAGTIYITNNIWACSNHGFGIQLMGDGGDPQAPYNGTCWENISGSNAIQTVCVGGIASNSVGESVCTVQGGSAADIWHPGLWVTASDTSLSWHGLSLQGQGRNVLISVCSDHSEQSNGECGVSAMNFYAPQTTVNQSATNGPGWCIDTNTLQVHVYEYSIVGNPYMAAGGVTADNAAAVLMGSCNPSIPNPSATNNGVGDISFFNGIVKGGGFKIWSGDQGDGSSSIQNLISEQALEAMVWFAGPTGGGWSVSGLHQLADCDGGDCAGVRADGGVIPVIGSAVTKMIGAVEPLGFSSVTGGLGNPTVNATTTNTFGYISPYKIRAQSDAAAREFPAVIAIGSPLLSSTMTGGNVSACGTCTLTTGKTDPSGGTNAIQIADTSGGGESEMVATSDGGAVVGDTFLVSIWARPTTGNCCTSGGVGEFRLTSGGDVCAQSGSTFINLTPYSNSNSWQHYIGPCKLSSYSAPSTPELGLNTASTTTMQFSMPQLVLFHGYTDDEIAEIANNWGTWSSACTAGQLCSVTGPVGGSSFDPTNPGTLGGTTPAINIFTKALSLPEQSGTPASVSATTTIGAASGNHWPAFNPNSAGNRYFCGLTGSVTSGHIAAFNQTGTVCDIVDGGTGTGSGTVTNFAANAITTGSQNFATAAVSSPGISPVLTFSLANAPAHKVFMNNTGSAAAPDYQSIGEADLPAATVFTDQAATFGAHAYNFSAATVTLPSVFVRTDTAATFGAHLFDFSAATIKAPIAAAFATTANGNFGYDTTNKNWHFWANAADEFLGLFASLPGDAKCVQTSVTASVLTLVPATGACGSGSGPTLQVGTVNNSSQAVLNFDQAYTTAVAGGAVAFKNTSGGIVEAQLQNTDGGGNAALLMTQTGARAGDYPAYSSPTSVVNTTPGVAVNAQTGTSYTVLTGDRGKLITQSNASASTYTLPQANSTGFDTNFFFCVQNFGSGGSLTITPTTSTINGASSLLVLPGQSACINSDNTNYLARITKFGAATSGSIGGAIVGAGCDTGTVTISGAATGAHQHATATPNGDPGNGISWGAYVSGTDTVTVKVCSAITVTPTSLTYEVTLQ